MTKKRTKNNIKRGQNNFNFFKKNENLNLKTKKKRTNKRKIYNSQSNIQHRKRIYKKYIFKKNKKT